MRKPIKEIREKALENWRWAVAFKKSYADGQAELMKRFSDFMAVGGYTNYRTLSDGMFSNIQYQNGEINALVDVLIDLGAEKYMDDTKIKRHEPTYLYQLECIETSLRDAKEDAEQEKRGLA